MYVDRIHVGHAYAAVVSMFLVLQLPDPTGPLNEPNDSKVETVEDDDIGTAAPATGWTFQFRGGTGDLSGFTR